MDDAKKTAMCIDLLQTIEQQADRIRELSSPAASPWIRVTPETMPEIEHTVLLNIKDDFGHTSHGITGRLRKTGDKHWFSTDMLPWPVENVTHYAHINPPKEDE